MEIIKRAKGDAGEGIPWNANQKDVQEEINRRTHKAGYTDKDGQPIERQKIVSMSTNEKYRKNYVKIFGHN